MANFIDESTICSRAKHYRGFKRQAYPINSGSRRFSVISIDLYGFQSLASSHGFKGILSVVDNMSCFVRYFPLNSKRGSEILQTLLDGWFTYFGFPSIIHSDNAKEFT